MNIQDNINQNESLTPIQKTIFFQQEYHIQESPSIYRSLADMQKNYDQFQINIIRYDLDLQSSHNFYNKLMQGQSETIIKKLINLNQYLDYPQKSLRKERFIKIRDYSKLFQSFDSQKQKNGITNSQDLLYIFISVVSEIQRFQYLQKYYTTIILIQGEWLEVNTFQQTYIKLYPCQCQANKNVFINLSGYDNRRNITEMIKLSQEQNNIYISFVVDDVSLLTYNNPDQGIYIIPISKNSSHFEIEYLFKEYLYEIIEDPLFIYLQIGVNQQFKIHQYILQNIINKLDSISFKKLIIHVQIMSTNEYLIQQLLRQYLEIYQSIINGLQTCAPNETLPSIYADQNYRESIQFIIDNLKKQPRIIKILKQYLKERQAIAGFEISQTISEQSDEIKISKVFCTYIPNGSLINQINLYHKEQTFVNSDTQEYINSEEQIIFYSNLCKIDEMRMETYTYFDCYAEFSLNGDVKILKNGVAINQERYDLQQIYWKKKSKDCIYKIKNKQIFKLYGYDNQDFIEIFSLETKQVKVISRAAEISKSIGYYKYLDKKDQDFIKLRLGGTCVDGPNDSLLVIGGISKDELKIMNVIEYIQFNESSFSSAKFKKQTLKIEQQMTFYPYYQNIVLTNETQVLILASANHNTPYQFYYNQSSLQKEFVLIFDEELSYTPLTLEQTNKDINFYDYMEKSYSQIYLKSQNCWVLSSKAYLNNMDTNKNFKSQDQIEQFMKQNYIIKNGSMVKEENGVPLDQEEQQDTRNHFGTNQNFALLQQILVLSKIYLDLENKKVFVRTECFQLEHKQYKITLDKNKEIYEI